MEAGSNVRFEFVECRNDGTLCPRESVNVKLRQWTKASPRMASQVRDSQHAGWRNAEIGLRVSFTAEALAASQTLYVCIYRHWSPCVDRRSAQQRVLVKINSDGTLEVHESIQRSGKPVASAFDSSTSTTTLLIPLVPFSFKLPASAALLDEWKGQARNVHVFFAVRAPAAYLRVLPSTKDSLSVEQYPKRVSKPSSPEPIDFSHVIPSSQTAENSAHNVLMSSPSTLMSSSSALSSSSSPSSSAAPSSASKTPSQVAPFSATTSGGASAAQKRSGTEITLALKGSSENLLPTTKARRIGDGGAAESRDQQFSFAQHHQHQHQHQQQQHPQHQHHQHHPQQMGFPATTMVDGMHGYGNFSFPFAAYKQDEVFLYAPHSSGPSALMQSPASSGLLSQPDQQQPGVINYDHMQHLLLGMHGGMPSGMLVSSFQGAATGPAATAHMQ